jgi:anionic cell wall polymer biosynthesis LytR-Cps2A-Psr (LCP) family protein
MKDQEIKDRQTIRKIYQLYNSIGIGNRDNVRIVKDIILLVENIRDTKLKFRGLMVLIDAIAESKRPWYY